MKIARYKRVQRYLLFYRNNFGFSHINTYTSSNSSGRNHHQSRPLVVLADGTFCKAALDNKLNIHEQLRVYFNQHVQILTTSCVIRELELLGGESYGALQVAKQYKKISCRHSNNDQNEPTTAADCIYKAVSHGKNEECYFVATQDPVLTEQLKTTIAACPILYINYRTVLLDRPSRLATELVERRNTAKVNVEENEKKELKSLKRKLNLIGVGDDDENQTTMKKKRRKIKGPNPLSCKKKKKMMKNLSSKAAGNAAATGENDERRKEKRKRRKRRTDGGKSVKPNE